jgi:hypothetical protein
MTSTKPTRTHLMRRTLIRCALIVSAVGMVAAVGHSTGANDHQATTTQVAVSSAPAGETGCWMEWEPGSSEGMWGRLDQMPAGSTRIDCDALVEPTDAVQAPSAEVVAEAPAAKPAAKPAANVQEDDPSWSCARSGNRICGPGNPMGAPAGCYRDGHLVVPWTRFELDQYGNPSSDPLWAQIKSPC